jgi:peroxiredoxin family protein
VNATPYSMAAVLATGDLERFYAGLSMLVSSAADGGRCAALASFRSLEVMLDEDLLQHAQDPDLTPGLSWNGRDTFARSLLELRDTALGLDSLSLYACSASVEAMSLTAGAVEDRLAGVMSTPRFLRESRGATLLFV